MNVLLRLAFLLAAAAPASAASYRESPFIAKMPAVDGSDFYFFTSYEASDTDKVIFLANYQPLQYVEFGPMYYMMDPNALYEIHVDTNGDCKEDFTFQFRFSNQLQDLQWQVGDKSVSIPLRAAGVISAADESKSNIQESYSITLVKGDRRAGRRFPVADMNGNTTFGKAIDFVGVKTFGGDQSHYFQGLNGYQAYFDSKIIRIGIPGCSSTGRVFVGQRDEHYNANWRGLFDLFNMDITGPPDARQMDNHGQSVTVIALEVPISCLVPSSNTVIGAWTTSSVRQARVLNPAATYAKPSQEGGPWVQVSRGGMPLVNDVLIGMEDKNLYNASKPINDSRFLDYFTHPALPQLIQAQFGFSPPALPRNDLLSAYLTGFDGLNSTTGGCEMLRLNPGMPIRPRLSQNTLGALKCFDPGPTLNLSRPDCDPAGFPNGRRPGDDVVDITLRMAMGQLLPSSSAPDGNQPYTDGVMNTDWFFFDTFPFEFSPHYLDDGHKYPETGSDTFPETIYPAQ